MYELHYLSVRGVAVSTSRPGHTHVVCTSLRKTAEKLCSSPPFFSLTSSSRPLLHRIGVLVRQRAFSDSEVQRAQYTVSFFWDQSEQGQLKERLLVVDDRQKDSGGFVADTGMSQTGEGRPLLDPRVRMVGGSFLPTGYSPVPDDPQHEPEVGELVSRTTPIAVPQSVRESRRPANGRKLRMSASMGDARFNQVLGSMSFPGTPAPIDHEESVQLPPRKSSSINYPPGEPVFSSHQSSVDLSSPDPYQRKHAQSCHAAVPIQDTRPPSPVHESPPEDLGFVEFDPDFDVSAPHLMKLFNMLDKDGNGRLSYEELREGLSSVRGLHELPPAKVLQVINMIDVDKSHDISQEEFVAAFQHLASKAMAGKIGGSLVELFCYTYGPETAVCRWIYSKNQDEQLNQRQVEANIDEFFHEPDEDVMPGDVRWISMTGVEPSIIVRLASKYKLHPLLVEDVISTDKERMKVDRSGNVLQVLVGRCIMTESAQGFPALRKEQLTMFLIEDQGTVISVQRSPSEINNLLLARVMYAGSKLRLNGPRFLVYAIMDSAVDELFPILRRFRKKLKGLHNDVTSLKKTSLETVHCIQHIIREVNLLQLWLSPLGAVANRLMSELPAEGDAEMKKHLEDLQDHIHALKEQTFSMAGWAKSLNDEYLNEQQYRMNQVIYILTMTTTILLPAQLLAGVFGMNFEVLPLVKLPYGFTVFLALTCAVSTGILLVFRRIGWL